MITYALTLAFVGAAAHGFARWHWDRIRNNKPIHHGRFLALWVLMGGVAAWLWLPWPAAFAAFPVAMGVFSNVFRKKLNSLRGLPKGYMGQELTLFQKLYTSLKPSFSGAFNWLKKEYPGRSQYDLFCHLVAVKYLSGTEAASVANVIEASAVVLGTIGWWIL